jgi:plasmid replication initiation protein
VIKVAVDEINTHSNINVAYGLRKTGRQITHIQLSFGMKKNKKNKATQSIGDFVNANPELTRGKSEWEVRQLMDRRKNDG